MLDLALVGTIGIKVGISLLSAVCGAMICKKDKPYKELEDIVNSILAQTNIYERNECDGIKIYSRVLYIESNKIGYSINVSVPIGCTINDFNKVGDMIKAQIYGINDISIEYIECGVIRINLIMVSLPQKLLYEGNNIKPISNNKGISIDLGVDIYGCTVSINFKNNPHTYIVGCTGSGKSSQLRTLLLELVLKYCDVIDLVLIDFKVVELALFKNVKCCESYITDIDDVVDMIDSLLEECSKRFNMFEQCGCVDIFGYNNKRKNNKLKYKIVIIEEYSMMFDDKKAVKKLKKLIAICRACGIYIILVTQRPSYDILDSVIKANVSNRICMSVEDSKNSIIALDTEGAELLRVGESIIKINGSITKYKSYYIDEVNCAKLLEPYKKTKEVGQFSNKVIHINTNTTIKTSVPIKSTTESDINNNSDFDLSFIDKL